MGRTLTVISQPTKIYRTAVFFVKPLDKKKNWNKNSFVGFGFRQMKIEGSAKSLPTFRQWRKENPTEDFERDYPIEIIWENDEYKSITFQTECFRISTKYKTLAELNKVHAELMKLSKKPVWAAVVVLDDLDYLIEVSPASDANESPQELVWVPRMNAFQIEKARS